MDENGLIGIAKQTSGRVQSAAGSLIGDSPTQIRGKVREVKGAVQQRYGDAADAARALIDEHSLTALLAAGTLGLAIGLFLGRR